MVSDSLSESVGSEQTAPSPLTYSERFHRVFPQYLAIGMTYEQFWDMDSTLVVDYRKADEIRNTKRNQEMWLQGMYVYEAICDASPILRAFGKKGTKPHPYPSEPYSLTNKQREERCLKQDEKVFKKGLAKMQALMKTNNKRFEEQEMMKNVNDG